MPVEPAGPDELARHEALIERWIEREREQDPLFVAGERDPGMRRWYVRLRGEERDFVAVWLTLGEYTLQHESYLMPAPEERQAECYEFLLRRNLGFYGMGFAIGAEDAVYLSGRLPLSALDEAELDRIVGSTYAYVEANFRPAMRIGFGSRFRG